MITENEAAVAAALEQDLGRKPFEAWLADIAPTVGEAKDAEKHVRKWMRRSTGFSRCRSCPAAAGSSTSRTAPC